MINIVTKLNNMMLDGTPHLEMVEACSGIDLESCFDPNFEPPIDFVEECRKRCLGYEDVLMFTTIAEGVDTEDMSAMLATRREHEEITRQLRDEMKAFCGEMQVLSTESCAICEKCAYPDAPCRHPDRMFPCIESYGILVTDLAEKNGITFMSGSGLVTWFSLILYKRA